MKSGVGDPCLILLTNTGLYRGCVCWKLEVITKYCETLKIDFFFKFSIPKCYHTIKI